MFRAAALSSMLLAALPAVCALEPSPAEQDATAHAHYRDCIARTAAMVGNPEAQRLAQKHGLQILNVTWEDTGRFKDSAVGPNISDMTIQVQQMDPRTGTFGLTCMPVIRFPNFSDTSADLSLDKFFLLVGNEKGRGLRRVTLREFLGDLRGYLHDPKSWKGDRGSLLADRDTHVLVSAQACFLPVPKQGIAQFNPVLFNYQSYEGDPAVLTILATREGTSVTVIDNKRDAFQAGQTWGQRLFFNQNGQRASLTGQRMSDYRADPENRPVAPDPKAPEAAGQQGLNMVLLIQVPLKQKNSQGGGFGMVCKSEAKGLAFEGGGRSDIEEAVIGHGKVEGPFTEIANLEIQRDEKFPVRVTVQFYKATSNGVVSEQDMAEIAAQIDRVYKQADYVGSLVTEGLTSRPTEHGGDLVEPPGWWAAFWERHRKNTGQDPAATMEMLRKLYGPNWQPRDEAELQEALKKAAK